MPRAATGSFHTPCFLADLPSRAVAHGLRRQLVAHAASPLSSTMWARSPIAASRQFPGIFLRLIIVNMMIFMMTLSFSPNTTATSWRHRLSSTYFSATSRQSISDDLLHDMLGRAATLRRRMSRSAYDVVAICPFTYMFEVYCTQYRAQYRLHARDIISLEHILGFKCVTRQREPGTDGALSCRYHDAFARFRCRPLPIARVLMTGACCSRHIFLRALLELFHL